MAYLEDYDPEDERAALLGGGATAAPGGGSAPAAASPAPASSGFQPISAYFTANQGAGAGMAQDLAGDVSQQGREAVQSWSPDKVPGAVGRAESLGSQEGIASELQQRANDPRYTSGMSGLDAYLATRDSGGAFDTLNKQFGALDWNFVGTQGPTGPEAPTAPTAPTPKEHMTSLGGSAPGGPGDTQTKINLHNENNAIDRQNAVAQKKYEKANKAYGSAMDEYNNKNADYLKQKGEYDSKRNEFLRAFGL